MQQKAGPQADKPDELGSLIAITIATKNRWDDLRHTLGRIRDFGLGQVTVLIADDNSDTACPFDINAILPNSIIWRHNESGGPTLRRNEMMARLTVKYVLSIDDDSYPSQGSLTEAIEYAEANEDIFCLSFPIYNPVLKSYQLKSRQEQPYAVKSFVACSGLLNRQRFTELGGYRPELTIYREEEDLTVRALQLGYKTVHYPALMFHHTASQSGRSLEKMDYFGTRNVLLWNDWYVPNNQKPYRQFRTLTQRILSLLTTRRRGFLNGLIAGARDINKYKGLRQPLAKSIYKQWRDMPSN